MYLKRLLLAVAGIFALVLNSSPLYASNDLLKKLYVKPFKRTTLDKPFSMEGDFGFLATNGNTNTTTFKTSLDADHETKSWANRYFTEFIYRRNNTTDKRAGRVTAQRFLAAVQFDYKLKDSSDRLFLYAEYDDDRFNGFRFQSALAAGYSTVAWKNQKTQLRYSVGPGLSYAQRRADNDNLDFEYEGIEEAIVRASLDYRWKISKGARFRQFISAEAGEENQRSRSETSISADLIGSLALKWSFIMIYNKTDVVNVNQLNTETSISLIYKFFLVRFKRAETPLVL